jgi:DNA polymerase-3 subunit beta
VTSEGTRLTFASADGFRLAVADLTLPAAPAEAIEIVIPARALRELSRLVADANEPVEMRINPGRTKVKFALTDLELVAQLIQGTFPNYSQLIPADYTTRVVVPVEEFKREARIAAIFARDGSGIIRLQIEPGKLTVSARADEVGNNQGEIEAEVERKDELKMEGETGGETSKIAFNSRYLQDVLNALGGVEKVALEITTPSSQGVFRPLAEDDYVHVVMPMFVQW